MWTVAVVIDTCLEPEGIRTISPDREDTKSTVDNEYRLLFWTLLEKEDVETIRKNLCNIRHSLIAVSEEKQTICETVISDEYGCDEEFYEILSCDTDILWWFEEESLTELIPHRRAIELLKSYLEFNYEEMMPSEFQETLDAAGFTEEEIRKLGY